LSVYICNSGYGGFRQNSCCFSSVAVPRILLPRYYYLSWLLCLRSVA
jgi:hypothetical protein